MAEPLIPGGYILLSRKIMESEIFKKPPLYLKVWIYLLSKAQHKDYRQLKRGQLWTNIPEIQEACSWYVGFRKETPSKKQIYTILEWLRNPYEQDNEKDTKGTMIVTTKGTQGMLIYIENFNHYQTSKNYEGNDEGNNEIPMKELRKDDEGNNINKNDKNDKNVNKDVPLKKEKIYTKEDKEYLLAEYLSKQIAKRLNKPLKKEKDLQRWAADFNKMVRLDNYDIEEIKQVLMFSQKNDFWQTNILSAAKFRKQYLTLLSQMKRDEGKGKPDTGKKTNKFHNFIQNNEYTGDDLEAIARKRFEEKIKKLGIATEEEK